MIIKYLSVTMDNDMLLWERQEDAEDILLGNELFADDKVFLYEIEVESANLNDDNVLIDYGDCGAEFFKDPEQRIKDFDDMIEEVYKVKRCPRAWEFKIELTRHVNNKPELPF